MEQFIILSRNLQGAACVKLIVDATSHPDLFEFGQLLDILEPKLISTQFENHLETLRLFAYGSFMDLSPEHQLSDKQLYKLKQLSILVLAQSNYSLHYSLLLKKLDISSIRELEDMIINAIYHDVFVAKLDQRNQCLLLEKGIGRDVNVLAMIDKLERWNQTSLGIISSIESIKAEFIVRSADLKKDQENFNSAFERAKTMTSGFDDRGGKRSTQRRRI